MLAKNQVLKCIEISPPRVLATLDNIILNISYAIGLWVKASMKFYELEEKKKKKNEDERKEDQNTEKVNNDEAKDEAGEDQASAGVDGENKEKEKTESSGETPKQDEAPKKVCR